jgi:hypothetical protein
VQLDADVCMEDLVELVQFLLDQHNQEVIVLPLLVVWVVLVYIIVVFLIQHIQLFQIKEDVI